MARLPTNFALSLWLGFLSVTGLSELAGLAGMSTLLGHALEAPAGQGMRGVFIAVVTLGTASLLACALAMINAADERRVRMGEVLAFGGIGIATSMVAAGLLFGEPFANVFDRIDLALWSVALSLLALGFDTVVHAPDDEADDLAFHKALLEIEASIPRERHDRYVKTPDASAGEV